MKQFLIFISILISIAGLQSLEAQECKQVLPTLRDYHVERWGERYVSGAGLIPEPSDSKTCEKIRYDLRVHGGCYQAASKIANSRGLKNILQRTETGVPLIVQQATDHLQKIRGDIAEVNAARAAQNLPRHRYADDLAKAQQTRIERATQGVRRSQKLYADSLAKQKKAQLDMTAAKSSYLAVHGKLVANGCDDLDLISK